jgi:uncharacterized membrane protein
MADKSLTSRFSQYFIAGIIAVLPLWITGWIIVFVMQVLAIFGNPFSSGIVLLLRFISPDMAEKAQHPMFQYIIGIVLVVTALCIIGWVARRMIGRKLITLFDRLIGTIPIAKMIYGTVKQLLTTFQTRPEGYHRVVLIDFPSPEMKTIGLVTRIFKDKDTGRELAAVYVPTTPNPTSGYLEIVPLDKITTTTMTVDEAMAFIVSGGAVAPDTMNYDKSADLPGQEEQKPVQE